MKILYRLKQNPLRKIHLLLSFYLILFSFNLMAEPVPRLSEEDIDKQLTAVENKREVTAIAFSSDGKLLAYGAEDNQVRLWDTYSGRLLKTFEAHTQPITSVAFSQDGLILAASSKDKSIHLWDINSKTLLRTFEVQPDAANVIAFHPEDEILVSSSNKAVKLWDIQSGALHKKVFKWRVHKMGAAIFSPDGKMFAIASSDLKIRLWQMPSLKMYKQRLTCTKYQQINTLDFSPNSRLLASGFSHGLVCIWDTQSRQLIKRFSNTVTEKALNTVAFNAEGNQLAYSFYDKIYLWEVGTEKSVALPITEYDSHYITGLDFNPSYAQANILAYASSDGGVYLWDIQNNKRFGVFAANAEGKWLSCLAQQCLCSGEPCVQKAAPVVTSEPELATVPKKTPEEPSPPISENEPEEAPIPEVKAEAEVSPTPEIVAPEVSPKPEIIAVEAAPKPEIIAPQVDVSPTPEKVVPQTETASTQDIEIIESESGVLPYLLMGMILIGMAIVLFYRAFICKKNAALLTIPLLQLPQTYALLKRFRCLNQVLTKNEVSEKSIEQAIAFLKMGATEQTEILAKRFGAKDWENMTSECFKVYLPDNFPLNLASCLLYFPDREVKQLPTPILQKGVVITLNSAQLQVLRPYGEDTSNLWLVPHHVDLTNWLLSPNPLESFTRVLAEQVKLRQISPYQTHSGVNKNAIFFGRTQILDRIINREPANYLVIGGRQIGKSSLLKYLVRHYQNDPQVECHYMTLHGDTLQEQFAVTLGLPSESDLNEILKHLFEGPSGQRRLFLIDQADQFIESDMKQGYRVLNHFRSLSEAGQCYFILAGFWALYYSSVLDSHSPLKNFGEAITLAELETEASYDLAIKPMKTMHLRYKSDDLIEMLLTATGRRANLIALVCNEMLKGLKTHQRVLEKEEVEQALNSEAVRDALKGWSQLSVNDEENRLDRIIVYSTIKQGDFQLDALMHSLEKQDCIYSVEQVIQSLDRLALSFVIQRDSAGMYTYSVPLFREMLLEDDIDELLRWALKEEIF
jgi:hypothetical protein